MILTLRSRFVNKNGLNKCVEPADIRFQIDISFAIFLISTGKSFFVLSAS